MAALAAADEEHDGDDDEEALLNGRPLKCPWTET